MKTLTKTLALPLMCLLGLSMINNALAEVETAVGDKTINVSVSGKTMLTYHTDTVIPPEGVDKLYARSGFIHPVYSPSGKVLSDDFPVGYAHQHALFSAWTKATFKHEAVDFWNQHRGTGSAREVKTTIIDDSTFETELLQFSHNGGPAIKERWTIHIHDSSDPFIFDISVEQECATDEEVYLHPYHYGGFGFRGSAHWNSGDKEHFEGPMQVLTSDGIADIVDSNHTRPNWVAAFGPIDGSSAGLAIMNHPDSFRHPQPVRVHPEVPYFVYSPVVAGSFILKPGMAYKARYRIVTFDGAPDADRIEKWYEEYATKNQ